ncbi:MAG: carboxypeptidase regulatory-like domain-containing protein [Acidobacteria bacterium]|nr:carboxypeptidase regulatory-like domain-containing protein [Acidobacteriota bacterium]
MTERGFEILSKRWTIVFSIILASGIFMLTGSIDSVSASPHRGGRVEGVVVSAETGAPLAGVEVWLDRVAETDLAPRRRATTNASGVFVFNRVHPGNYRLYAQKTGYLLVDYLQQQQVDPQAYLTVQDGATISNLQISLPLGGKVSGTVVDEQGNPAVGIIVKLLALTPSGDDVSTLSVVSTRTDEAGHYTLDGLYGGRYVVRAEQRSIGQTSARLGFAYYPDVDSWQSATPIEVGPGEALTDVNITFAPKPGQPVITGTIRDAQTGQPLQGVNIDLVDGSNLGIHTKTAADGTYRLEGMPTGRYTISAHGEGVGDGYEWVLEKTSVGPGQNVIDFDLTPAPLVVATVEYIGSGRPPAPGDYMVSVRVGDNARGITYSGQEAFEFRGLKPGKARIGVGFAALQYELAAVLLDEQDITGQVFDLRSGDKLTGVRIVITDDPAADVRIED